MTYFGLLSALGAMTFVVLWLYGVPRFGIEGIQTAEYRRSIAALEALVDKERDVFAHWFVERRREIQLMTQGELVSAGVQGVRLTGKRNEENRTRLERQLSMVKDSNGGAYNYLYLVNPVNGAMIASTERSMHQVPPEHIDLLMESAQPGLTEFVHLPEGKDRQEVLITGQIRGVDLDGYPNGELNGVLVASVDLRAPLRGEDRAVRQYLGASGALMLLDRNKRILASSAALNQALLLAPDYDYLRNAVEAGAEGVKVLNAPDGSEVLMAFRHLHLGASDGLSLLATRGADEALVSIRAMFTRLVGLGILLFFLAMGIVLFAAGRIAASEAQIHQLNAQLEQRVVQRTAELEEANSHLKQTLNYLGQTQADLVESAKLASLGALVAGVAHELNTPIGNALMAASTLNDEARQFEETFGSGMTRKAFEQHLDRTRTGTEMIMSNISRASELISGFKQLALDQSTDQRRIFDLADALSDVGSAMGPTLRTVPFRLMLTPLSGNITLDSYPGPFSRSIINLISNALLHGFEGRSSGAMEITAKLLDDQHVEIVFADNGVGMAEDVRRRVFDPFFTTKMGQGGSGLGMHIVYNNVTKLLGGHIEVESTRGEGTHIRIVLPLRAPQVTLVDTGPKITA
jgi:signal transduction histidine kinase